VAYKDEFFQAFLEMLKYSSTLKRPCTNCKRCDKCTENLPVEIEFDETLNKLIIGLFHLKS
jgi:L-lactate utilization protein LutB